MAAPERIELEPAECCGGARYEIGDTRTCEHADGCQFSSRPAPITEEPVSTPDMAPEEPQEPEKPARKRASSTPAKRGKK